jgi:hypothetical protein
MAAIQLFGAGREQRIYALPPYTQVVSLDFEDHPFEATKADHPCGLCGAEDSYLDEVIIDDAAGGCSSARTPIIAKRARAAGHAERTRHDPCFISSRPHQTLWRAYRLRGCVLRPLSRRGDGDRRRKRLGQIDACSTAWPGILARCGAGRLRHPRRRAARHADHVRARTPDAGPHRLGLCPPARARRAAHGRQRGRQCGRAADGRGRAALRRHPRRALDWLGRVEIDADRIDDRPRPFRAACSSGCRSRATW